MTVPENSILRVVQQLTWDDGNIMQNVFNCRVFGGTPPYNEQDIADDMADWMDEIYDGIAVAIANDISAGEATTYIYDSGDDDWDEVASQVPVFVPSAGGEYLATGVAAMIRANTTDPDVQGRKYFGGFTEDVAEDGGWTSSLQVLLTAAAIDWVTPMVGAASGASIVPGVWSPTNLLLYDFVLHLIVNTIANYQRRRRPGVGI